jgi:hypothetical protein
MPVTSFLGPLIGILGKIGEKVYDRLESAHGVKAEVSLGVVPGVTRGLIVVTVTNSTPTPQRVTGVGMELSPREAGSLWPTQFPPPFQPPPQLVTQIDHYTVGFSYDEMREAVLRRRVELNNARVQIAAAKVSLASGRVLRANARHIKALQF